MAEFLSRLKFGRDGLIPAIVQDVASGQVLMMAYMNREAVEKTLATGETWFWSRSRQKLWHKGETSGNVQRVRKLYFDCDADTLLVQVEQRDAACHEGYFSCFHYLVDGGEVRVEGERVFDPEEVYGRRDGGAAEGQVASVFPGDSAKRVAPGDAGAGESIGPLVLRDLYGVIKERQKFRPEGSYTAALFEAGLEEILKKVGEEAVEVVVAGAKGRNGNLVAETADLLYHLLVLLAEAGVDLEEIWAELDSRRRS